jgi:phosphoglucosamine mutase
MAQPLTCVPSAQLGKAHRVEDAQGRYIEFCKSTFPNELDLRGLRIVVDCAHGATYHVAPPVLHELGAEVFAIGDAPDGLNINDGVGATHTENLARAVREHRADVGIALDGDGDRLVMADASGRTYDGDQLLYVIATDRARHGGVAGVVGTLMSNLALERALAAQGIAFARSKVGDRYVLEMLHEKGWLYGGENSGHLLCLDKHTTGDGIVSALQVLKAMQEQDRTLAELAGAFALFPQVLLNVRVPRGFDWRASPALVQACAAAEARLGSRGRLLLRPSGTEPVLRVMVEGEDAADVDAIAADLARVVEQSAAAA